MFSRPRIRHGDFFKLFSPWGLVLTKSNNVLLGLGLILDPVIQATTPNKQCCNFSIDSLDSGIKMVVDVKTGDNSANITAVVYKIKTTPPRLPARCHVGLHMKV